MSRYFAPRHRVYVFLQILFLLVALIFFSLWHFSVWLPPGVAVLMIAVVAAAMSIHPDMLSWHKAAWMLIIGLFLAVELGAIHHAEQDQAAQFSEILDQFKENVNTITGGDSFALVTAVLLPIDKTNAFRLILQDEGKYDLSDVHVEVMRWPQPDFGTPAWVQQTLAGKNANIMSADLGTVSHRTPKIVPISVSAPDGGSIAEYSIRVYARNRPTHESLRIRKNQSNGLWESSYKVFDDNNSKSLEESRPEWRGFVLLPPG